MKSFVQLTLAFLLVTTTLSFAQHNPLKDPNICGRPTCKGNGKFKYEPGTQQNYKYSVDVRSLFNGTSRNESSIYIEGIVTLSFITSCDGLLTLSDLKLSKNSQFTRLHQFSEDFNDMLSEFSVRFAFHDGIISEVCPENDEKNWTLNFKKGILSMLQNTMKRFDLDYTGMEEDIRGKCKTFYKVIGAKETSLIIEKNKDLSSCQSRSKLHSIVQSTPYSFRPNFEEGQNLLKSKSKCEISIDHNIYNKITCEETHVLQPFSNQDAGATTIVMQRLILLSEEVGIVEEQSEITRRTLLLFNHIPSMKPIHDELKISRDLIKKMCKQSTDDVQIEFSDLFTKFIQTLRVLSYPALSVLYEHSSVTCPTGKKHLLDALPNVGTAASVIVMKDIILKNAIPETTVKEWITSLAFIGRPDDDIMEALAKLLEVKGFDPVSVLSISALSYTYCKQNHNCLSNEGLYSIVKFINNGIIKFYSNYDQNQSDDHENLIIALKALSNIGVITENFERHLNNIIENSETDISIRVAAIEVYRRLSCEKYRNYFEKLFWNYNENTEIRIVSYLQVMRCPNYLVMKTIKHSLENEEVNQVGSFVWTHLKNLLKSSDPTKVEIQSLLSDINLSKKFNSDVRRFSHNRHGSIFFEDYNFGANYDNNIIFSPSSYIPRSAMLNFTIDLFGESINLLEIYGRMEGLEYYIEALFGTNGTLNAKKIPEKLFSNTRWARSISDNSVLKTAIDKLPNILENKFGEPKVSLGLKVFGNDLNYATFNGDQEIRSAINTLNPIDHLKRILSGKEINYNKATMFLDSSYIVPSGAGLPISLSAVGTASINLKLFGSLHAAGFIKTKELDFKTDIRPSISLDVTGTMSVDAFYSNTGIKIKSSMYTSTAIEGNIKIRGTKLISAKFSIPRQLSEIFHAKSELVVMKNNVEQYQSGLSKNLISKSICSWPAVDKTVGLKLCGDYHFMNVTKINNAPYFILAGPTGFRLFLEKSDPTAKIYLFEYKWTDKEDTSIASLTFDTPGSSLRRILSANITLHRQTKNLTVLLESSEGVLLARGKFKNTDEEKYLQIALDINERKHFDTSLSLIRHESRHGFIYYPKAYLGVNGERVSEVQGILKLVSKKGISQYDVDLKFQTKRLTSKLFGYISFAANSIATNLKLDYKFLNTKEQRVNLEFTLANRSPRNIQDIRGTCSLFSTAYPHFNFDAKLKYQRGNGPIECKFDLYSNPLPIDHPEADLNKLKLEWLFSYKTLADGNPTLNTTLSVNRESTGLNLKGQFSYEVRVPDINMLFLVKYAKDKEVSITIFWSHPHSTLEQMEGRINITVPSFTSMILHGKLKEKKSSDYIVEMSGTWFSGHSITARGFYQDKSSSRSVNRHLKLLLKSPSFQDINTDLLYYRDNNEIKIDLKADQNKNDYNFYLKHNNVSPEKTDSEVKIKYKSKYYSMISSVYLGDHREISVEFHFDQLRDVHFALWHYNKETYKAAGFEVKYDANRDNNQKLVVSTNFTKIAYFNYEGNLLVSYPGRTILANFNLDSSDSRHFYTLGRLSWADQQSLAISLAVNYDINQKIYLSIDSYIVTPFENYKRISIIGGYHQIDNMQHVNGTIFWKHNEHATIDFYKNYLIRNSTFECEFRSSLTSTLKNIPTLSATLRHSHNISRVSSVAKLMYSPKHIIDFKSNWKIDIDRNCVNLTGTIVATTPFRNFNRGYLISKIYLINNKYIRGIADLDLDHKKLITSLQGHFHKLTNCMLEFNITTPIEKYNEINARFGLSEENKHIVAEILYPSGGVGFEILFKINTLNNFNIKFHLASPISFLQKIIIAGKLMPDRADFRIGWNSLLLGFNGVWHYVNVTDLEYSCKIYTPIEGYEENGIVTKLIFKEGLDFEVSIKLSEHKLGITIFGTPKPKILKEFGIETKGIYSDKIQDSSISKYKDKDDDDDEDEDPLSWTGLIKLDAIVYPTMQGTLDIDQEGPLYILQSKLSLPEGVAEINDEFLFIDIFKMTNKLEITTPYDSYKLIRSDYDFEIVRGQKYLLALTLDYQNHTKWIKTGGIAQFIFNTSENEEVTYNIKLHLDTPFKAFPLLYADALLEKEENVYRSNISVTTNSSDISMTTSTEIDNGYLEADISLKARTPSFRIPSTDIVLKKDFKSDDNLLDININIPEILKKEIHLETNWLYKSWKQFYLIIHFNTPFKGMESSYGAIQVSITNITSEFWTAIRLHPLNIEVNSTLHDHVFRLISDINFNGKSFPVSLTSTILQSGVNRKDFIGNLILRDKLFKVTGTVYLLGQIPVETHFKLIPEDGSDSLDLEYKLESKENGYIAIGNIQHSRRFTKFEFNLLTTHKYNWEMDLQIFTSNEQYNKILVHANATSTTAGSSISIEAHTPITRLENPKLGASVLASGQQHYGRAYYYDIDNSKGTIDIEWVWLFLENMLIKMKGFYENDKYNSESRLNLFYLNPNRSFNYLKLGTDANVDKLWSAGSNLTLSIPNYQDMFLESHIKLPPPNKETHSIFGKLRYEKNFRMIEYLAKYRTVLSEKKYGSWSNVSLVDKNHMYGNVEVEWNNKRVNNYVDLRRSENAFNILYKLRTPKFDHKETFVTEMSYMNSGAYHNMTCDVFYPETRSVGSAQVDFKEFANMNGIINVTVPYRNINYTGVDFMTRTNAYVYNRYLKVFWPHDTAILNCKYNTKRGFTLLERNTTGILIAEIPLTTRHIAKINFNYEEKPQLSTGRTTVDYNGNKVLEGKYNCLSESRAGFDKDTIHVEVQNKVVPVGADYVHGYEYGAPRDGSDAPTVDKKYLHLYHLQNLTKFNISGEMNVRISSTGRHYALTAIHSNRSVKLWTDYDVLDQQFKQRSRLELSPSNWIEYDLDLLNNTVNDIFDAQRVQINVSYPRRNFTALGSYNISDSSASTDVSLIWDKDNKTVQAGLDFNHGSENRKELQFHIKHPTFERDVILFGEYEIDKEFIEGKLILNYSNDPEKTLKIGAQCNNNSSRNLFNYAYNLWAIHDATNLNLDTHGSFYWNSDAYNTVHYTGYKRSYLPLQTAEAVAKINVKQNEIELKKKTGHELTYLWAKYGGHFPIYTANISTTRDQNNATGDFFLNFKEKLVQLDFNITTDGSQSLHIYGIIPDARSALFNIWRDYEDIRVSDVAYYLRMNHSRLIMSSLQWRPELIQDIHYGIRSSIKRSYSDFLQGINDSRQYIRSEMNDALHGVWYDAKPIIQHFLDDMKELRVIEKDFDELKLFVNKFYDDNEFYLKDIANMSMQIFEELSLKSKLQSLPAIFGEIWEVMGDSGTKIKKSIIWGSEKLKTYYKNTTDFLHGLLDGDPIEHLSDALKTIVQKYDEFIKDTHVSFLLWMEQLWKETYTLIVNNWHKTLATVEPTFIKIVHYIETMVWNTSKEFLDFLYIRKSELIESPYFAKFTNFTHDLDRFYRDMTGENTISSIIKYIKVAWNFLNERYFNKIPFSKELKDIVSEILVELNELKNLPSIQYLIDKWSEIFSKVKWLFDYFDVENRLHRFITLLHMKLTDMSQTALQTENRFRKSKTKFIFEPADGIMILEQKLPMSWHAFNETPKIEEIPELKMIYDILNYFQTSRSSFWDFYYDYKPYTEISGWLPPFKAQALLVGSRYYVTFDRRYYDFRGKCSYLLATDFLDRNFSVVVSYDNNAKTHELLLLINNTVIHIDVFNDIVKIGNTQTQFLPVQIDHTFIYRETDIITVSSELGFNLECNMKFDVCLFDVSGLYFGKTAGLWGTINNEPSDDLLTSEKWKAKPNELNQFVNSWALDKQSDCIKNHSIEIKEIPNQIQILCNEFFINKMSQFTTCFSRVSAQPFLIMCLNSITEEEACSSAIGYINLCASSNTPLRIPDVCVKCNSINGTFLNEGKTIRLEGEKLPQSADTVFIIEAKDCNKNLKNIDSVIELLEKELNELNLTNNRYSIVTFGGDGVFDEPRNIIFNSNIFTDFRTIITFFDSIPIGKGNSDIFAAITFATNLIFRPGVSKNFILLSCSNCKENNMKLDYAILHQLLLESDVTLHILMNEEFSLQKTRENKIPFGIDRIHAYTQKDNRVLKGDTALRKHVSLPKSTLGNCMPLALETNGTLFSIKHLESGKVNVVKKFATVFAKRVASSAIPNNCVDCECTAFNTGVSYMECFPCIYPTRMNFDYGFDENEALSVMQPGDDIISSSEL